MNHKAQQQFKNHHISNLRQTHTRFNSQLVVHGFLKNLQREIVQLNMQRGIVVQSVQCHTVFRFFPLKIYGKTYHAHQNGILNDLYFFPLNQNKVYTSYSTQNESELSFLNIMMVLVS